MSSARVYRQLVHKLRVQRGSGQPDLVSERPREGSRKGGWGKYKDSENAPTLVSFDEHCQVDVAFLLHIGAIAEYTPPAAPAPDEEGG